MSEAKRIDFLHLVGLGGSNKVMAGELSRLVRRALSGERSRELLNRPPLKSGPGGLLYPFAADMAAVAVHYHRTSARVLWDLYQSDATRLEPLYEGLLEAIAGDDRGWMAEGLSFSVLPFRTRSVEAGERQVVGVVKNALIEGAAQRGINLRLDPQKPDLSIHVRGAEDREGAAYLTVSIDLAGRAMHQRGYRTMSGEAPLREDLAANLVMLSRYDGRREVLIDPLAGSGTLVIEAALMASGKSIWMSGRSPDAARMPCLQDEMSRFSKALFSDTAAQVYASEIDEDVYGALDRSLMTSGVGSQATTHLGAFQDWDLSAALEGKKEGLILSNPPYGARLGATTRELRELYRDLGGWCRQFRGFRAAFIVGEAEADPEQRQGPSVVRLFQDSFGGDPRVKKPISNGPLRAQFLLYDL